MRTISAGLAAAQAVRSARVRATVSFETRGTAPGLPMVAWRKLVDNAGQTTFRSVALVARPGPEGAPAMLWFKATPTAIEMAVVADPTDAAAWSGATWTTIVASGALAVAAVYQNPTLLRLFYIDAANNVRLRESANDGATWGAAQTTYSGGDAVGDLVTAMIDWDGTIDGRRAHGFSTYNAGTGLYTPRFGSWNSGSGWVTQESSA